MAEYQAQNMFTMTGRTAVITGGGSGIGRMIAKGFFANGASVTLVDWLQDRLDSSRRKPPDLITNGSADELSRVQGDLSQESGVAGVVSEIKASHKEVDVLVMCAGVRKVNKIAFTPGESLLKLVEATQSLSFQDLDYSFRINLYSQYFLVAGLLGLVGAAATKGGGRGSIIMVSSAASKHNGQFVPAYQMSKAAIDHLVRIMASEFADHYIRVNSINPGLFPSALNPMDPNHPESNMRFAGQMPARRPGTEQEMAATALYLSSPAGGFVTGTNIVIDGGRLLVAAGSISSKL
ncbi:NAD(P)-binding Rossmann-fold containing protein [Venustampulla echinocandica]|uniref:NAD(P)-binding Rossmann-fold containing protein n=1 Tax=Venustampulla echinocandica TaxID=2656787 RepID=A0A370U1I5_9HELO|nr:NAD(P)-binding Rossmann-fold containing protein [Venustampulla echinocandica]RDL41625.1 NAD(P)-binding Rossmann-fold containing protein [Venustampulla echinocandica]